MQGNTRARLLEAAERVLIEEGVLALTTRRVGEVSRLNPTLITYHFGSVGTLLDTLREHNLSPMLKRWERIEEPVPDGAEPVAVLLERWLRPLLGPACYNRGGRALAVIDEIAAHGEHEAGAALLEKLALVGERLARALGPHLPHLSRAELGQRLRFIGGAALGPPPRARLAPGEHDPALGEAALAALLRFARASLEPATEGLAQQGVRREKARA